MLSWGPEALDEIHGAGDVAEDLFGHGADADEANLWEDAGVAFGVGDVEGGFDHYGDVAFGFFGKFLETFAIADVLSPTWRLYVDGFELAAEVFVAGNAFEGLAKGIYVVSADFEIAVPVTLIGECVNLVDDEVLETAKAEGFSFFDSIKPSDHSLAAC